MTIFVIPHHVKDRSMQYTGFQQKSLEAQSLHKGAYPDYENKCKDSPSSTNTNKNAAI